MTHQIGEVGLPRPIPKKEYRWPRSGCYSDSSRSASAAQCFQERSVNDYRPIYSSISVYAPPLDRYRETDFSIPTWKRLGSGSSSFAHSLSETTPRCNSSYVPMKIGSFIVLLILKSTVYGLWGLLRFLKMPPAESAYGFHGHRVARKHHSLGRKGRR